MSVPQNKRNLLISTLVAVARPLMVATIMPKIKPDMEALGALLNRQGDK